MRGGEEHSKGSVTSIKKVDFLAHYDYNTNKYKLLQARTNLTYLFLYGATA
jgi:hypothetical protein